MKHKYRFTPILGWSHSRYQIFSFCKRSYFLQYYRKFVPKKSAKKLEELRALSSFPRQKGLLIHELMENILKMIQKNRFEIRQNDFEKFVDKRVDSHISELPFFEIYYEGLDFPNEDFKKEVKNKISIFINSEFYHWLIKQVKNKYTNPKDWLIEPSQYGETRLAGLKAYCIVDFLMPTQDQVYIFDWKSGQPSESHIKQLLGYSLTAKSEYQFDPAKIVTELIYLTDEEIVRKSYKPSVDEIEDFKDTITSQTQELYGYCKDYKNNVPKGIKDFPKTDDLNKCIKCNFKEYCKRGEFGE